MTVYCANGSRRRSVFAGTSIPVPDVLTISQSLLLAAGLSAVDTPLLLSLGLSSLPSLITTDEFCAITPQEAPPLWTIILAATPISGASAAAAWCNYVLWHYCCECTPGEGGACTSFTYHGTDTAWNGTTRGADTFGSAGVQYDVHWYESGALQHTYTTVIGPFGMLWDYPAAEGGSEGGTHREFRLWEQVTTWDAATGTIVSGGIVVTIDSAIDGDGIQYGRVEFCPAYDGPPVIPPPAALPDAEATDANPYPDAACASFADVCAKLADIATLARLGFNDRLNTTVTPSGTLTLTGDGASVIVADAILFHVESVPPGVSYEGSTPPNYTERRPDAPFGWYAVGTESAWYPRTQLAWVDQWSGAIPKDATQLTWHLQAGVTVTASLFVRSAS